MSPAVTFTVVSLLSCSIATVLLEANMNSACATSVSMQLGKRLPVCCTPIDRSQAQHSPGRVIATITTAEIAIWHTFSRAGLTRLTLTPNIRHSSSIQLISQSFHARIQPAKQTRDRIFFFVPMGLPFRNCHAECSAVTKVTNVPRMERGHST